MISKQHLLNEIKRTASNNDGRPLGSAAFENQTGLKKSDWYGRYWSRWGDALVEAGFQANTFNQAYDSEFLCKKYALLVRELGHIPVAGDIRIKAREDKSFPSHNVWGRLGNKDQLIQQVTNYCSSLTEWSDVLKILSEYKPTSKKIQLQDNAASSLQKDGYVYLIQSGKHYKIGMTNDISRRANEISIELPERSEVIHTISTDDPSGIEAYWHKRFSEKRGNGEWFELSPSDIKSFKRRKFM